MLYQPLGEELGQKPRILRQLDTEEGGREGGILMQLDTEGMEMEGKRRIWGTGTGGRLATDTVHQPIQQAELRGVKIIQQQLNCKMTSFASEDVLTR